MSLRFIIASIVLIVGLPTFIILGAKFLYKLADKLEKDANR